MGARSNHPFNAASNRSVSERERLIAQLNEKEKERVQTIRQQHQTDVADRRSKQADGRDQRITEERNKLLRETPRPELTPDGRSDSRGRSAAQVQRQAEQQVDQANIQEIQAIAQDRDRQIDQVFQENGLSYEQFSEERAHLESMRTIAKDDRGNDRST